MKKRKKSSFWTFLFSFLPGAAEMYMGFMNMGVSLLILFFGTVFLASVTNIGPLLFLVAIVWFYGFFHARNMASLSQEELEQTEDQYLVFDSSMEKYLSDKKGRKLMAIALIIIGVMVIWNTAFSFIGQYVTNDLFGEIFWNIKNMIPKFVVAALAIFIGIKLIKGKKEEIYKIEGEEEK